MAFTAPVLNIGEGLANGILAGGEALSKAIDYVRDQSKNAKAASGAMSALAAMKDSNGNPLVPQQVMDVFNKQSPQGQVAIAGILSQRAGNMWGAQNQLMLQNNQAGNEEKVHSTNTATDYNIAAQHGVVPGIKPNQMPAQPVVPNSNAPANTQPQQNGLPSHVPFNPIVPQKFINGQNVAVQHADPNNTNSPITHVFNPQTGQWVAVPAGQ